MIFLIVGDLHIRDTRPQYRIDDFTETQFQKIQWCLDKASENQCDYVLVSGDVTDTPKLSYYTTQRYIQLFKHYDNIPIITPYGQHDLLYHVDKDNTPLKTMEVSKSIYVSDDGGEGWVLGKGVRLFGVDWGKQIPTSDYPGFKVLLIHKMFIDEKLWPSQEAERSTIFLRETNWDLIVSGDNHQHFVHEFRQRFHVNCGSLMRQSIDQIDHHPTAYLFDTHSRVLTKLDIPHQPAEEVFAIEEAIERKQKTSVLEAFVNKIHGATEITGLDFVGNLEQRLAMDDISVGLRQLGEEVIKYAAEELHSRRGNRNPV
jgi:DNA repair exonuclease SbcCD nuclease subunit